MTDPARALASATRLVPLDGDDVNADTHVLPTIGVAKELCSADQARSFGAVYGRFRLGIVAAGHDYTSFDFNERDRGLVAGYADEINFGCVRACVLGKDSIPLGTHVSSRGTLTGDANVR